jgi:hypothetical protein
LRTFRKSSGKDHGKFKAGAANAPKQSKTIPLPFYYTNVYHARCIPLHECYTYLLPPLPLSASSACECARESCNCVAPSHAPGAGPDSAPLPCLPPPLPASWELPIHRSTTTR